MVNVETTNPTQVFAEYMASCVSGGVPTYLFDFMRDHFWFVPMFDGMGVGVKCAIPIKNQTEEHQAVLSDGLKYSMFMLHIQGGVSDGTSSMIANIVRPKLDHLFHEMVIPLYKKHEAVVVGSSIPTAALYKAPECKDPFNPDAWVLPEEPPITAKDAFPSIIPPKVDYEDKPPKVIVGQSISGTSDGSKYTVIMSGDYYVAARVRMDGQVSIRVDGSINSHVITLMTSIGITKADTGSHYSVHAKCKNRAEVLMMLGALVTAFRYETIGIPPCTYDLTALIPKELE